MAFTNEFDSTFKHVKRYRPCFSEEQLQALRLALETGCSDACQSLVMDNVLVLAKALSAYTRHLQPSDAEDVFQTVVLKAMQGASQYDPAKGRPSTFFYTLARRAAIHCLQVMRRDRARYPQFSSNGDDGFRVTDVPDREHSGPSDEDRLPALLSRLKRLPPRYRMVIRKRMQNHSLKEIGLSLGISRERVRQLETRALDYIAGGAPIRKRGAPRKSRNRKNRTLARIARSSLTT